MRDEYLGTVYEETADGEGKSTALVIRLGYGASAVPRYLHDTDRVVQLHART